MISRIGNVIYWACLGASGILLILSIMAFLFSIIEFWPHVLYYTDVHDYSNEHTKNMSVFDRARGHSRQLAHQDAYYSFVRILKGEVVLLAVIAAIFFLIGRSARYILSNK